MGMAFSNYSPKIFKKSFFVVNVSSFLFLHETSRVDKSEGTDFENRKSFFQILAKNTQIRNFL